MRSAPTSRPRVAALRSRAGSAFTLLETGLAIVIIGVGVLAMIEAQSAFIQRNAWSTHSSTATFLANELRELTRGWSRHDRFSGGLYFDDPVAHTGFRGWGPEAGEVAAADFDDLDDLDGVVFGDAPAPDLPGPVSLRLPGPVGAFRQIITETDWNGATVQVNGVDQPLRGWSQYVMVDKVDPHDYALAPAYSNDFFVAPAAGAPGVEVDGFPVRVTVVILFQSEVEAGAQEIARVVWVVP
jgi:type II secretory pathway pseudopilin PulG